ncbi:hypothetical protein B4N89_12165 [Embleya scabrispora]|uniref:C2H2-type domain-containing protein n=1 Tax=Embleya scabrispora TaxID=159449 RepID=A0A1T3NY38_9ACTN|nr:hypothetical protein [Embleya scabrispora]OPC81602.1 hypothetical protein B4N89_12165 [Embleya scabrispora]
MENPTVVHESYSFVCMSCGRGWERDYEIHHATDLHGLRLCRYYSEGTLVPSPFTKPACEHCDGTRLRILPAGRVASAAGTPRPVAAVKAVKPIKAPKPPKAPKAPKPAKVPAPRGASRWHLPSLHRSA